jgi:hypothetical protein
MVERHRCVLNVVYFCACEPIKFSCTRDGRMVKWWTWRRLVDRGHFNLRPDWQTIGQNYSHRSVPQPHDASPACDGVQRSTSQCKEIQRSAAQCSAMQRIQRIAAQYSAVHLVQRSAAQFSAVQLYAAQYIAMQRSSALCSVVQRNTVHYSAAQR